MTSTPTQQTDTDVRQRRINEIKALRQSGDRKQCLLQIEQALRDLPWHWQLANQHAHELRTTGNPKQALVVINDAIAREPVVWLFVEKSSIQAQMGLLSKAFSTLDNAPDAFQEKLLNHRNNLKRMAVHSEVIALRQAGKHAESLACIEKAITVLPEHQELFCQHAICLRNLGRFSEAHEVVDEGIQQQPEAPRLYQEKSSIFAMERDFDQGFSVLDNAPKALQPRFENHRAFLKRQQVNHQCQQLRDMGSFEQALKTIQTALNDLPVNAQMICEHAQCLRLLGRVDEALSVLDEGLKSFKDNALYMTRANIFVALERFTEAHEVLQDPALPENLPPRIALLARVSFQLGERESAIEQVSQYQDTEPCRLCYIELLRRSDRVVEALKVAQQSHKQYPKWPFRMEEARCLLALEHYDELNSWLTTWQNTDGKPKAFFHIATQLAQKQFDYSRVIELSEKALPLWPDALDLYQPYLLSAIRLKDQQRVTTIISDLTEKYGDSGHAQRILTTAWSQMGDQEFALNISEQSVKKDPENTQSCIHYVDKLIQLGQAKQALAFLDTCPDTVKQRELIKLARAKTLWQQGRYKEAVTALKLVCDLQYLKPQTVQTAIDFLIQVGEYYEARKILDRVDTAVPDSQIPHAIGLSKIQEAEGNLLGAIRVMTRLYNHYPQHEGIINRLVLLTLARCDADKADYFYKKLLKNKVLQHRTESEKHTPTMHGQMINEFKLLSMDITLSDDPLVLGQQLPDANDNSMLAISVIRRMFELNRLNPPSNTRSNQQTARAIPLKVFQYWNTPEPPEQVQELMNQCQQVNADCEYTRFNDFTAIQYLKKQGLFQAARAFQIAQSPATKADILRLALLWREGGIYLDADDLCLNPFSQHLDHSTEICLYREPGHSSLGNNFMASKADTPMIEAALTQATENVLSVSSESTWFSTGPALVTRCFVSHYITPDLHLKPGAVVLLMPELRRFLAHHQQVQYKQTDQHWVKAFQDKLWRAQLRE